MKEIVTNYEEGAEYARTERMELREKIERLREEIEKLKVGKAFKVEFPSKHKIYAKFDTLEEVIGLKNLEKGISIKHVVTEWKKFKKRKIVLKKFSNAVKSQYNRDGISKHCKNFSIILIEIKDLI